MDDRIKTKAKITSFEMRYYMYILKLHMHLRVATIKKAICKQLRVRQLKIGSKSCFGTNIKKFALLIMNTTEEK